MVAFNVHPGRAAKNKKVRVQSSRNSLWAGVWAPVTVLGITLFDWYTKHRLASLRDMAIRLVLFVSLAFVYALCLRKVQTSQTLKHPRSSALGVIAVLSIFIAAIIYFLRAFVIHR
jgi:hypothetical protein